MLTLENLRILLRIPESNQDENALLELIMSKVKYSLLNELQIDCLNKKHEILALDLCVQQYLKIINTTKNVSNDISVSAVENYNTHKSII